MFLEGFKVPSVANRIFIISLICVVFCQGFSTNSILTIAGDPEDPEMVWAQNLTCDECRAHARAAVKIIYNKTELKGWEHVGIAYCEGKYEHDVHKAQKCMKTVKKVFSLVEHWAPKVEHWKVNISEVVCSDVLKKCIHPCCENNVPQQIRLSFANRDIVGSGKMRVSWVTLNNASGPYGVRYFRTNQPEAEMRVSESDSVTYTEGGWRGLIHRATMVGLVPGTSYTYQIISPSSQVNSDQFTFSTLPLDAGSSAHPLRIVSVVDMGWDIYSDDTIKDLTELVQKKKVDFIVHPGDIGYSDGFVEGWDIFGRKIEKISAVVPYMTGVGNHESIWWNSTGYKVRWWMPYADYGAPDDAIFYSMELQNISMLMLNTEDVHSTPSITPLEAQWTSSVLARAYADRTKRLKFVMHHRPMYYEDDSNNGVILRNIVEKAYIKNQVDLVLCGHVHNYERSFPVANGTVTGKSYANPSAPVYIVNGGAGNREGNRRVLGTPKQPWTAFRTAEVSYMLLNFVVEESSATIDATLLRSADNVELDSFSIRKY